MMSYSNARMLEFDPAFQVVEIPAEFSPIVEYGLALRNFPSEMSIGVLILGVVGTHPTLQR